MKPALNAASGSGTGGGAQSLWLVRAAAAARRRLGRLQGAGWALADQCIVSAANFLTIYLFARHLEASAFGAFMLSYTGLLLLTNLQNALLIQPHNVLGATLATPEYQRFTGALALAQVALCAAAGVTLAVAGWIVMRLHSPAAGMALLALAAAVAPWMGQEFVRRVLYTRGESRAAALNDGVSYGLQLGGAFSLAMAWPGRASPETALLVLGGSSFAGVLLGFWQLRNHARIRGAGGVAQIRRTWREAWRFGRWLLAQNAVVWFGAQGHSWVVGLLLGAEQVGLYRAATHLVNVMNPLLQTSFSYLPSRGSAVFQGGGTAGLARWVKSMRRVLFLAPLPFCVVLVGFPQWALRLAYGERYAGTDLALILALSTIGVCLTFAKFPFDIGLLALRATRSIFHVYLIPVALLLTSGVALIHFFGILGVPLSALVINAALLAATWIAYRRQLAGARLAETADARAAA
jgi:O-antigen/teichoic acid export membrane protein